MSGISEQKKATDRLFRMNGPLPRTI